MYGRPERAVVLVGHGSRIPVVQADLARLALAVSAITRDPIVEPSGQAELKATLDRLAGHGATEILVQPYFLGMVGALSRRLREGLQLWTNEHRGIRISLGQPLGDHPLVTAAIEDSAVHCLGGRRGTVVLLGHGSPDPAWSGSLHAQVGRLEGAGHFERVVAAFLDHQAPRLDEVLDGLEGEVAVVPYFLSRGLHTSEELPRLVEGRRGRQHLARFWADDPRIALAVAERIHHSRTSWILSSAWRNHRRPQTGGL